ncbi:MAG: hypothetical protein AAFR31_12340 [Cyanobacteria bacterium J06627_8]
MTTQTVPYATTAPASDIIAAQQLIDSFEQSQTPGVWPHLNKSKIIETLRDRVSNPFRLDQKQQPFCGPASIVFELIRKQPIRYIHMCQQLYEQGKFQGYTRTVEAAYQLRDNSRDVDMAQADWMLIATMRESENLLFNIDPRAPKLIRNLAGMTKSWEMRGWTKEILGYPRVTYHHAYLFRDIAVMNQAKAAIAKGGVAFALVTAGGLFSTEEMVTRSDSKSVRNIALPDHWIALVDIADIPSTLSWRGIAYRTDKARLHFDTFTWARRVPVDIGRAAFRRFFWGVVIGQP